MKIQQPNSRQRHRQLDLPNGKAEVWLENVGDRVSLQTVHPNGSGGSNWKRCEFFGCLGEAVIRETKCLRHSSRDEIENYLNNVSTIDTVLSFRGMEVTQELVDLVLCSPVVNDKYIKVSLNFTGADVSARLNFVDFAFPHWVAFTGAIVRDSVRFEQCVFHDRVSADFAFYNGGPPSFTRVEFNNEVDFSYVHAERVSIGFIDCTFDQQLLANGNSCTLLVRNSKFQRDLCISNADSEAIILDACHIDGKLELNNTHCSSFRISKLKTLSTHGIGPIQVKNDFTLTYAQFGVRVNIEVHAQNLNFSGTQFIQGGQIVADCTRIYLDQLSTGGPLRISGKNHLEKPEILSLQDADLGNMIFSNVNMSHCMFYEARDLTKVIIESTVTFSNPPNWWSVKRRCIADEFTWRISYSDWFSKSWKNAWDRAVKHLEEENDQKLLPNINLHASQVAVVYRDLRHSFEAKKDITGAADFYYGEMEMRRQNKQTPLLERIIIFLYWIISGYSLEAFRALFSLTILILGGAVVMYNFGFDTQTVQPSFIDSLIFSFRAAIPGLGSSSSLTNTGEFTEIFLSIFGPVVAAMAVLAFRERIKR